MAIGVLRALADAGRTVPDDVSVVGFDDVPAAQYLRPRLTTVRQDFDAMASTGLDLLVRRLENRSDPPEPAPAVHQLVIRESTARPDAPAAAPARTSPVAANPSGWRGRRPPAAGRRPEW
jgi:DNA-binding LacI/PurR family transcriptional regulator